MAKESIQTVTSRNTNYKQVGASHKLENKITNHDQKFLEGQSHEQCALEARERNFWIETHDWYLLLQKVKYQLAPSHRQR
jgi:hypothetical protein